MKRIVGFVLLIVMLLLCGCEARPKSNDQTSFSHWNSDAPALNALIEYVHAVTDKASPDYIPPADRIATFDLDGTLIGELFPTYLEDVMLMRRIFDDPSYTPDEDMVAFGLIIRDHAVDRTFPAGFEYAFSSHLAKAFAGMTPKEYDDYVKNFLVSPVDGFEGMTYAEGYYLPMAEVIGYLLQNDFKCYIVSGSDRFTIRTFIKGVFDIPSENCIGSDAKLEAKDQGDAEDYDYQFTGDDTLVRAAQLLVKDVKTSKVLQIAREIGKQPVLSFGNSSGDVSMHNYALYNNRYRSAVFQLIADDDVRDYGHPEKGPELRRQWEDMGFHVISMRDDWKTIYGENVVRTGEFHWLEDYSDDKISEKNKRHGRRCRRRVASLDCAYFGQRYMDFSGRQMLRKVRGVNTQKDRPVGRLETFLFGSKHWICQNWYCVCVRYIRKAALETTAILSHTETERVLTRALEQSTDESDAE